MGLSRSLYQIAISNVEVTAGWNVCYTMFGDEMAGREDNYLLSMRYLLSLNTT
jgi:hypothetical protein